MSEKTADAIRQMEQVTPSAVMMPPPVVKMYERRDYRTRTDAPATHARLCEAKDGGNTYCLNYNGVDLITMHFAQEVKPYLRLHSDGDFQSQPFIQQFLMWTETSSDVTVTFEAPVEMWNMRPRRAQGSEAILGQVGAPLMYGVNGMYLPDWDLLVSWHGLPFSWHSETVEKSNGVFRAVMTLSAGKKPWVLLVRPHYYGEHLGYVTHKPWLFRPKDKAVTGWCSWEAYHSDVSQGDIERTAQALKPLRHYGLEYMQLDDGYQTEMVPAAPGKRISDSWLELNERFPGGHEAIIRSMKSGGFEPGIWTNATVNNKEAAETSEYCLRNADGTLIRGDWIQYCIDCTPEMLKEQVMPYYRAFRELGYTYVKSDALRHLIYDGLQEAVRLGLMDPETARAKHRAYLETAREGLGEDVYYLSCWGVLTGSIGVCDAMRVGTDTNPRWNAYSMQWRELARWFFAQRVMFTVDPDMVCVRGELDWARTALSLVSLSGSLFMVSDRVEDYDDKRLEMMKKTMPALTTRAAETGPIDYSTPACSPLPKDVPLDEASRLIAHIDKNDTTPFGSLWSVRFASGGRCWTVALRAAVAPLDALAMPLDGLALDPARRYAAFDFWTQEARFIENGALDMRTLKLGDCEVVALTDVTDGCASLIGSDRHVSMDCVSVENQTSEEGRLILNLRGFEGLCVRYTIFPGALRGSVEEVHGAMADIAVRSDGFFTLAVRFDGETARVVIR